MGTHLSKRPKHLSYKPVTLRTIATFYIQQITRELNLNAPLDIINSIILFFDENQFAWTIKLNLNATSSAVYHNVSYPVTLFRTNIKTNVDVLFSIQKLYDTATLIINSNRWKLTNAVGMYKQSHHKIKSQLYIGIKCAELNHEEIYIKEYQSNSIGMLSLDFKSLPKKSITFHFYFEILMEPEMKEILDNLIKANSNYGFSKAYCLWIIDKKRLTMLLKTNGSEIKSSQFYSNESAFYLSLYKFDKSSEYPLNIKLCMLQDLYGRKDEMTIINSNIKILDDNGNKYECSLDNITYSANIPMNDSININTIKSIEFFSHLVNKSIYE
eukprot:324441_1